MINHRGINRDSYKYLCSLMAQILELDVDTEERIKEYIENHGVDNFFKDYEKMELPYEVYEKLEGLQFVLETLSDKTLEESIGGAL
ncbi:hypothetical protein [Clostridium beijerinckii]|uniref:Uncharacterized protein n=1 Tax=Clostridium beijerinckii TaxID=1520 RepID=A0A1S9N5T9_CLOBE|nr:hypothetical protein [Clostridium beijerinckii]OOP72812.1 hypothetical protein CBEIBR21_13410 [Clostridium beijerinckii]